MSRKPRAQAQATVAKPAPQQAPAPEAEKAPAQAPDAEAPTQAPVAQVSPKFPNFVLLTNDAQNELGIVRGIDAIARATEFAAERNENVHVKADNGRWHATVLPTGEVKFTPAQAGLAPRTPRVLATEPSGKKAILIQLAARPEGASIKELAAATGWIVASPWKWEFTNKDGKGVCDRFRYNLKVEKINGETRYFVTKMGAPTAEGKATEAADSVQQDASKATEAADSVQQDASK